MRAALLPWLVSRGIGLAALLVAHEVVHRNATKHAGATLRVHQGLLGWDAGWYESISLHGYRGAGGESLRFFPLWPELARAVHLIGIPPSVSLVILANLFWFGALVVIFRLCLTLGLDVRISRLALWLIALMPAAISTVMGYAEPLLVLLVASALLLLRSAQAEEFIGLQRWMAILSIGVLAGLTRPIGVLLCVPIAIEALKRRHVGERFLGILAASGPVIGLGIYLSWCASVFNDALLPLRVQTETMHHGGLTDPVSELVGSLREATSGHLTVVMHLPWVALAIGLVILGFRRLPLSLAAYSAAIVVVALSGHNLDSIERYFIAAPPLFITGAQLLAGRSWRYLFLAALGFLMFCTSTLSFLNFVVP